MSNAAIKSMLPSLEPLYLVLFLAAINCCVHLGIDGEQERQGHVGNSVGISLTAVVLLEKVLDGLNLKSASDSNDMVFLFWLAGLGLSSVPERYSAAVGVLLLGISAARPFLAFVLFRRKLQQIRNRNEARVDFTMVPDKGAQKPRVSGGLFNSISFDICIASALRELTLLPSLYPIKGDKIDLANWTYYYPDM